MEITKKARFSSVSKAEFIGLPIPCKKKQCGEFDEFVSLKQFLGATLTLNGLV
jgi:hypothetical protein